jgi:hypothetical protein
MSIAEAVRLAEAEKKISELLCRVADLEAMTQAESPEDRSEIAEDWLRGVLNAGQVEAANIKRQAVTQGFNWRTVPKMLAHQMALAHESSFKIMAKALSYAGRSELRPGDSVELARLSNAAARLTVASKLRPLTGTTNPSILWFARSKYRSVATRNEKRKHHAKGLLGQRVSRGEGP